MNTFTNPMPLIKAVDVLKAETFFAINLDMKQNGFAQWLSLFHLM